MRRFIELGYKGTHFHGWQRQPNATSVQQTLEEALSKILRQDIAIIGAGRTDAGVHARRMFAHFDIEQQLSLPEGRLSDALNTMCGRDITVRNICVVPDDMHARFSALSRTYRYFVHYGKDPFLNGLSWQSPAELDVTAMNNAAALLVCNDDFTSFAKLHSDAKTNICKLKKAFWQSITTASGGKGLMFEITADRFLRNMVRAVVGTLVEVGRGRLSLNDFRHIVEAHNRSVAGQSMPAHALYLWDVCY